MDRHGYFFAADGVFLLPLIERHVFRKDRHIHLQGKMIPRHIAALRGEIESVLSNAVHKV